MSLFWERLLDAVGAVAVGIVCLVALGGVLSLVVIACMEVMPLW